jgi:hypothetical protein
MRDRKGPCVAAASALVLALFVASVILVRAQASPPQPPQEGASKAVAGGGISAPGWMGTIDPNEEKAGLTLSSAKLAAEGPNLHVTTGPALTYWKTSPKASGDYTVKATFTESDYMGLNDHPHPYGIMIAGNDLGTAAQSYLYCSAYGNGTFIVRGMGPAPFAMGARRPTPNDAVHKAEAVHKSVTQEIAMSVKGDSVSCAINGVVVATYTKAELVVPGKLKSTDGLYGLRFAHNTDAIVSGLTVVGPAAK